jgi:hypothetical protein
MALLRNISIGLSADTKDFTLDTLRAASALDRIAESGRSAQSAVGGVEFTRPAGAGGLGVDRGGLGDASSMVAQLAGQLQAAMSGALGPLNTFGSRLSDQFNRVGGTLTTLARRIDAAIKFPQTKSALDQLQSALRSGITSASGAAEGSLSRLQRVTLALGPAADRAITAYRSFNSIRTLFANLGSWGDVARKPLDRLSKVDISTPGKSAGLLATQFRTIAPAAERATTAVQGLGIQIGLALGVAGLAFKATQALVGFFSGGIKGAMDLGETISKTREVFGESAGSVVKQAEEMATSFGLAKGPMLDAASNFGLIASGAGKSKEESAELAGSLTRLAADAASFYNVPMETALEKIRSGLVGESEPLRQFGVLLNETAVKAEAQALGLGKGAKGIDDSAKVTARASLIVKGLQTASGDLARTQDSAANQFRKSGGGVANFANTVGAILLPAVQSAIGAFNELFASIVETFESNRATIEAWAANVKASIDLVGLGIRNFGDFWAIAKLKAVENVSNILAAVETIPANMRIIGDYLRDNWLKILTDIISATRAMSDNIDTNLGNLFKSIQAFFRGEGWNFEWTGLLTGFEATAAQLPELVKPEFISMQEEIDSVMGGIVAKETARTATAQAPLAKPALPGTDTGEEGDRYHAAAAAELGSKEANSAIAKFVNAGPDEPAKATAKNTDLLVKLQQQTLDYLKTAKASGDSVALAIAQL